MVTFCLRDPFVIHRKSSVTQLKLSMIIASVSCNSKWVSLASVAQSRLGDIHMDAARYDTTHSSSFHPSTMSITAIAQDKVAFGTATKGRRTYGATEAILVRYVVSPKFAQH